MKYVPHAFTARFGVGHRDIFKWALILWHFGKSILHPATKAQEIKMMKTRRFFTYPILLLFLFAGALLAQNPTHEKGGHHKAKQEELKQALQLTDAQAQQMEAIHAKYRPQIKALKEGADQDPKTQEKIHSLRQQEKEEVAKILSPEQLEKMKALRAERRDGKCGPMHPHHNPEARQYFKTQVQPVLLAQRLKLEPEISAADKAAIQNLRDELQKLHAAKHEAHTAHPQGVPPSPEQREAFQQQRKAIVDQAEQIASRYQVQIASLHQEIQTQAEVWKAHNANMQHPSGDMHHGRGHHKTEGANAPEAQCPRMGARFLLMDPFEAPKARTSPGQADAGTSMRVFPSPASTRVSLQFSLPQASDVKVELVARDGRILQQVASGKYVAGEHFIDLDVQALAAGSYLFRLTTSDGARVKQFSVVK